MQKAPRARALLVALALLVWALPAAADGVADEADFHFRVAATRYEAGDFAGALEHFLASNRLVPNKNVVFNIARTFEQLRQPADAYRYYARALEGEPNPTTRLKIQEAITRIKPLVSLVRIESTPPGATVYVDRKDLGARGQTPLLLALPAGRFTFLAELPNHESAKTEALELKQGGDTSVHLPLTPIFGAVTIEAEPEGAQVRLDREDGPLLCASPCTAQIPPGRHVLHLSGSGYQSGEVVTEVIASGKVTVRPRLAAVFGALVVGADIRDALITVDGKPSGFTPAVLTVPVGEHEVRVSQSGYGPEARRVTIRRNEQTKVDVELIPTGEIAAASRSSEASEDAPASVSVITSAELRAMGYPTIAEAVRGIRGIYLSDDRSYQSVGVRGFSRPGDYGNRILVTIDGHPANDNYLGSSYVGYDGRVDLDDVERIEVVRGAGSVVYGTGAFFGVINLVTRGRQLRTHGEISGGAALEGVGRARATGVLRLGDEGGLWTSVSVARGAGRDFFFPEFKADPRSPDVELGADGRPVDGNARGVDGFDAGTVSGRVFWRSLTAQWFYHHRTKIMPAAPFDSTFGDPRSKVRDTRGFVELRFEPRLSSRVQSLTRAHANLYDFYGSYGSPQPVGYASETFRGRWIGGEQRFVFTPSDAVKITLGGEVQGHLQVKQFTADGTGVHTDRNDPFALGAGYLLGDFVPAPVLKISAGARLDYYSNTKFDPLAALNPRLVFIVSPWKGGRIKLMGGKAFRVPSRYELFGSSAEREPSPDLKLEQVISGELEVSHKLTDTLSLLAAGYTNYVTNLIELETAPSGRLRYQNTTSPVMVGGGELELRREWRQGWMLGVTTSLQKAVYLSAPELRQVPNSPYATGSAKGAAPIIGRSLMAMLRVSIESPRFDNNAAITDPAQGTSETGIIGDLVFTGEVERFNARYAVGVYNMADWRYDTVPSREYRQRVITQSGRTFLANVTVSF